MSILPEMFEKALSLGRALLTGTDVSEERLKKRLEVCSTCPHVKINGDGNMQCGICGCKVKRDRTLINLARYEETDKWGCKAPGGSKWKANNC